MKGFFKGLFDFFWPYFAAGILAGTLLALIYGLGGYIKFSVEPTAWDWSKIWFTFCAVLTAFCTVMSIILDSMVTTVASPPRTHKPWFVMRWMNMIQPYEATHSRAVLAASF